MSRFSFKCPECGNTLEAEPQYAGMKTDCPFCSKEIDIPKPQVTPMIAKPVLKPQPAIAAKPVPKLQPTPVSATPALKLRPAIAAKPVPKLQLPPVSATPALKPQPAIAAKTTGKEAEPEATPGTPQKKKKLRLPILIIFLVILLGSGSYLAYRGITYWLEVKEQNESMMVSIDVAKAEPDLKKRIEQLNTALSIYPKADQSEAKKLISEAENQIKQAEEARLQEIKRREEARKKAEEARLQELKRREEEKKRIQEKFDLALKQNREHSVYVMIKKENLPSTRFILFRYDSDFEEKVRLLQKSKSSLLAYNECVKNIIKKSNEKDDEKTFDKYALAHAMKLKKEADESRLKLPEYIAAASKAGAKLMTNAADTDFCDYRRAFQNVKPGKLLMVAFTKEGNIFVFTVSKKEQLPLFIEYKGKDIQDVSCANYNEQEKAIVTARQKEEEAKRKAEEFRQLVNNIRKNKVEAEKVFIQLDKEYQIAMKENLERQRALQLAKETQLRSINALPLDHLPFGLSRIETAVEPRIRDLVFFAKLQNDLNAVGGKLKHSEKQVFSSFDDIAGIQFKGKPSQGITYDWKPLVKNSPRTVSFWFYCNGYNKHDGGNAMLCYGTKNFGKYFCIETNRGKSLYCPWGGKTEAYISNGKIELKKWYHFAVVYDGVHRTSYLNGTLQKKDKVKLNTAESELMIGTRLNDTRHCFVGSIRNVAVYNRALSSAEVNVLNKYGLLD